MKTPRGAPRRKVTNLAIRRTVLVFTEGQKTEPQYLTRWHRAHRERVLVTVDPFHGAPLSLVERAVQRKKADRKAERRGAGSAYDEIWCMFDIDEHPNVDNAFALANGQGITLAVSNPCVELWFLLHFKPQTAWLDRHDAQQFADEFVGRGKTLTEAALNDLVNHHDDAVSRAQALDQMHQGHGSQPGSNPSSGVWRLIDTITVD